MPLPKRWPLLTLWFALVLTLVLWVGQVTPSLAQLFPLTPTTPLSSDPILRYRPQPGVNFPASTHWASASDCPPVSDPIATKGQASTPFQPRERVVPAHATNYGDRFPQNIYGQPVHNAPILVLHETVGSGSSTINFFQTPHYRESDQASYHALILRSGEIVYVVPPEKRAFGAGNSIFVGTNGPEAVKTHPKFAASVNNFAYHISLVTPTDGNNNRRSHSGYTPAQYQSLAWLAAQTGIPETRITTHQAVDRSGERMDPRSFNSTWFRQLRRSMATPPASTTTCTTPSAS